MKRKLLLYPPFFAPLIFVSAAMLYKSFGDINELLYGFPIYAITYVICFFISLAFQIILAWPLEKIFRRHNAHWIIYGITGYALAILFIGVCLGYGKSKVEVSFIFGLIGLFQGLLTYYFGRQNLTNKD